MAADGFIEFCTSHAHEQMKKPGVYLVKLSLAKDDFNPNDVWSTFRKYLSARDQAEWNCINCRNFVSRWGGLCIVDEANNTIRSAIFPRESALPHNLNAYKPSCGAVQMLVDRPIYKKAKRFLPLGASIGTAMEGGYSHFVVHFPDEVRMKEMETFLAEHKIKKEKEGDGELHYDMDTRVEMMTRILKDYPVEVVQTVADLMERQQLSRWENFADPAHALLALWQDTFNTTAFKLASEKEQENILIKVALKTDAVLLHSWRNGQLSLLYKDLSEQKMAWSEIEAKWNKSTDALHYKRTQRPPTQQQVEKAWQCISKLFGSEIKADDLKRGYCYDLAPFESQFQYLYRCRRPSLQEEKKINHIFSNLTIHKPAASASASVGPSSTNSEKPMEKSWVWFAKNVLPHATRIQVQTPSEFTMCIMTQAHNTKFLLNKWHHPLNPLAWFYTHNYEKPATHWNVVRDDQGYVDVESIFPFPHQWNAAKPQEKEIMVSPKKAEEPADAAVKKEEPAKKMEIAQEKSSAVKEKEQVSGNAALTTYLASLTTGRVVVAPPVEQRRPRFFMHIKGAYDTAYEKTDAKGLSIFPEDLKPELFPHRHVLEQFGREHYLVRDKNRAPSASMSGLEIARGDSGAMDKARTFKVWMPKSHLPLVYQISIFE